MNSKPISISLSPNTEKDDLFLALKLLFQPWRWKKQDKDGPWLLEREFKRYLGVKYAVSFNSGRSSLMAILNSLELEKKDEILLQAFTCNAAVNPIIWTGHRPVFVDVNENTFNLNPEDLEKKISPKSKAVVVQHTFGLPAQMDEIIRICQENNLILIEDCAHSLGAEYGSRVKRENHPAPSLEGAGSSTFQPRFVSGKVGTFGQAAFFSFSRDKIISSVYGGMVITDDAKLAEKVKEYQEKINYPSFCWIAQQLMHPLLMSWLALPIYKPLGKYLLILFQWLKILSKAVHWKEKRGLKPGYFPKRLPNALALLALNQFKKLERFNAHRQEIADFYYNELKETGFELPPNPKNEKQTFLRFSIKHAKAHQIIKKAWQKNFLIGDWYTNPIAPNDTKLEKMEYVAGSCPKAEKLAKETLNLPTHINISRKEAKKIINFLKA